MRSGLKRKGSLASFVPSGDPYPRQHSQYRNRQLLGLANHEVTQWADT
ncbi:MAG: hypothetical protein ACFCU9_12875 [Cyanophyceae cyanobacterium]